MSRYIIVLFSVFLSLTSSLALGSSVQTKKKIEAIFKMYDHGKYSQALAELDKVQKKIHLHQENKSNIQGLVFYWKGLCFVKMSNFDQAIKFLEKAIDLNFKAEDIYYEYGQSLYAMDKLKKARLAFRNSIKNRYKMAVSLYYIAYISQQLKDYKKAVSFYNAIEKLDDEQKAQVVQAARMQVGDIYLKQVEKMPNSFNSVKKYVIPQYKKALKWDEESKLAAEIKNKIKEVQRRYDLILFKMRNGIPTATPRHFLKFNALYGMNNNVNAITEDSKLSLNEKDYASSYYNAGFFGRYTFYPNSSYSISPELTLDYTKYSSTSDYIKINNTLNYTVGSQINYEHMANGSPATFFINIDYRIGEDDADSDDKLEKSTTTTSLTLSEGIQVWKGHPSTFRIKYADAKAVDESLSSQTQSVIWEQLVNKGTYSFFLYNDFSLTQYKESESLNNNAFLTRADLILPTIWNLVNPNLFLSYKSTNYIENSDRAIVNLISYGMSLNRPVGKKWYMTYNLIFDQQSGASDSDNYEAMKMSLNLDYIY